MSDIKGTIMMTLPGSVLMSEEECKEKKAFKHFNMEVEGKQGKKETLHIVTRQCRYAQKRINITKECYNHWVNPDNILEYKVSKEIAQKRVGAGIAELVKNLGGLDYTYKIFEE